MRFIIHRVMPHLLQRFDRLLLICCGISAAAVIGWASFAYAVWSSGHQIDRARIERTEAQTKYERLRSSAGELTQVEAKLNSANAELNRVLRVLAAAEQLAAQNKRSEQGDKISQTGSIRTAQPKRPGQ